MLGRLYLKRLDGGLSWDEFAEYASMLNQLIPGDVMLLKEPHHKKKTITMQRFAKANSIRANV